MMVLYRILINYCSIFYSLKSGLVIYLFSKQSCLHLNSRRKTMKKLLVLALVLVMLSVLFVGCSAPAEAPAEAPAKEEAPAEEAPAEEPAGPVKVGATIYRFDDNFMSYVRLGMEGVGAELGIELDIQDSQGDQAKQGEQVDLFLSKGVDSLAINLVDPQAASTIIEKAKAEDIPVIFYNKEPSADDMASYDKTWYVGTDSAAAGVIQGEMIAKAWLANPDWDTNGDGVMQYVLLKGEPGHPDAEARTKYAVEVAIEGGVEVEELAIDTGMWDPTQAGDKLAAWYASMGDSIEFVICNNDGMAIGAINYLQSEGFYSDDKFMPVVGVDAIPEALDLIEQGKLVGTVLNDASNQARATVELAANVAAGNDPAAGTDWVIDADKAVRVDYVGILLDNIDVAKECYGLK
jgi:methyl-galactoside transport system substrate-binding protein